MLVWGQRHLPGVPNGKEPIWGDEIERPGRFASSHTLRDEEGTLSWLDQLMNWKQWCENQPHLQSKHSWDKHLTPEVQHKLSWNFLSELSMKDLNNSKSVWGTPHNGIENISGEKCLNRVSWSDSNSMPQLSRTGSSFLGSSCSLHWRSTSHASKWRSDAQTTSLRKRPYVSL